MHGDVRVPETWVGGMQIGERDRGIDDIVGRERQHDGLRESDAALELPGVKAVFAVRPRRNVGHEVVDASHVSHCPARPAERVHVREDDLRGPHQPNVKR